MPSICTLGVVQSQWNLIGPSIAKLRPVAAEPFSPAMFLIMPDAKNATKIARQTISTSSVTPSQVRTRSTICFLRLGGIVSGMLSPSGTNIEQNSILVYTYHMNESITKPPPPRGRGATINPVGRFEKLDLLAEPDPDDYADGPDGGKLGRQLRTEIFTDTSRSIIATNDSPDVGFDFSLNPYRGCEHGCVYCFARPTHEYLGLSAGIDFETKLFAKPNAAALLREKLMHKNWVPAPIILSGVTDCYQPIERKLELTRACLAVLAEFRNPCAIITKNALVTRDVDHLADLAAHGAVAVNISVTTLDGDLARTMEPRASRPVLRLKAIATLATAGIPVNVIIGPVLPALTDHEIPRILKAASEAGATTASYVMLRLPYGVKDLFAAWLEEHYPDRKDRVLHRVQAMRGGKLYDSTYGTRMKGAGPFADQVAAMFDLYRRKYGLDRERPALSTAAFRRPPQGGQLSLF